jgi:hypothetical protein
MQAGGLHFLPTMQDKENQVFFQDQIKVLLTMRFRKNAAFLILHEFLLMAIREFSVAQARLCKEYKSERSV